MDHLPKGMIDTSIWENEPSEHLYHVEKAPVTDEAVMIDVALLKTYGNKSAAAARYIQGNFI